MRILGIDGSPIGGGRTATVLGVVLEGARAAGADAALIGLVDGDALTAVGAYDAFVVGTPVYRASFAAPLKGFLDALPRGMWGETTAPITGRAVAIVMTGATWHHYLALDDLRNALAGFFAAHVLTPGLYVPREGFGDDGALGAALSERAGATGAALVALAEAVAAAPGLRAVTPQA